MGALIMRAPFSCREGRPENRVGRASQRRTYWATKGAPDSRQLRKDHVTTGSSRLPVGAGSMSRAWLAFKSTSIDTRCST
jgi:hypothetical protein